MRLVAPEIAFALFLAALTVANNGDAANTITEELRSKGTNVKSFFEVANQLLQRLISPHESLAEW